MSTKEERKSWTVKEYYDEISSLLQNKPEAWDHTVRIIAAEVMFGYEKTAQTFGEVALKVLENKEGNRLLS
jgi:hypothetical protein